MSNSNVQRVGDRLALPDTVFSLPPFRVGPYELRAIAATPDMFEDKRKHVETDWTAGITRIDHAATGKKALWYFMRSLLTAIHYRSGLDDSITEESFTHSLATGLVEVARVNPLFWEAFIQVSEHILRPNSGWVEAAGGGTRS